MPPYQNDYKDLPWYENYFMTYMDWLKHKEMKDNYNIYFERAKVINFDTINHISVEVINFNAQKKNIKR